MSLSFTPHAVRAIILGAVIAITSVIAMPLISAAPEVAPQCKPDAALAHIPELPEGSGLAASRRTPGRFWSHNDSGDPVLFALDSGGHVRGQLKLSGADVHDWEAMSVGPCPAGSCLYVADIGDNDARRDRITVYRVPEPADGAASSQVTDTFHATYPDGPQDAEALLIPPDGRLHIVTKGDTGPVSVYRFPSELRTGTTVRLERVGSPRESRVSNANDRITDGTVSPDGRWVVLRTERALMFYRASDLLTGNWQEARRVALSSLGEPQGEGVTFGADNTVFLMSEGGGKRRPGAFARVTCGPAR